MVTECVPGDDILRQVKVSLATGMGIGFFVGCLLVLLYWASYRYLLPRLPHFPRITKNKGAASEGHELGAVQKKALKPPRRDVEQQTSNATTVSSVELGERNHRLQHGIQKLPRRDEAQQRGGNMASASGYMNSDAAHSVREEYRDSDGCTYVEFNDSNSYQQHNEDPDGYVNDNQYLGQHDEEPTYANVENVGNTEYDYITPPVGAQGWVSKHPQTEHGYLCMGNVPQQSKLPRTPR